MNDFTHIANAANPSSARTFVTVTAHPGILLNDIQRATLLKYGASPPINYGFSLIRFLLIAIVAFGAIISIINEFSNPRPH